MSTFKIANLLLLSNLLLNATEVISINDKNVSESRKDDSFHVAMEIGVKEDFWSPGLSGTLLDYETEGLKLGYATLKCKLYDTDVLTLEKFDTLSSTPNQNMLLEEYKKDRKEGSSTSLDGYRASIHFMKIFNKLTGNEKLGGLTYNYTTHNFIGKATLKEDAYYWYGNAPHGTEGQDYTSHSQGDILSFKTKFREHQVVYNGDVNSEDSLGKGYLGYFNAEWERPTNFTNLRTKDEIAVAFPAKYMTEGVIAGLKSMPRKTGVGFDVYLKFGWDYNVELANDSDLESLGLIRDSDKLNMNSGGIKLFYKISDIYSTNHMNVDFIMGADFYYSEVYKEQPTLLGLGEKFKDIDEERIYGLNAALEFTF